MQNKLQELTDLLYKEGLSRGMEEGERYMHQSKREADQTVAHARQEAEAIIAAARKEAEDLKAKAAADVKTASAQALQTVRKEIENLMVAKIGNQKYTSDPEFLKTIILEVAKRFSATESSDIALLLPESLKAELEPWVKGELSKVLGSPVQVDFSSKVSGGFTISPAQGGYYISMTDKTFDSLIAEYLRPVTRKLLFGE